MSYSQTPTHNLKAVIRETGIAADTLRAWERRYGLPHPERTPGGHRLYSEYDIATIKWLADRQDQGLSISRAVDLWKELKESSRDPLFESMSVRETMPAVVDLTSARHAWVHACMAFNEVAAEQVLNQAFATNTVETVSTEVLQRGLFEIGELWYRDKATVQQEHFASVLATRRLDALLSAAPSPTRPETILVACPPDELHGMPLLFLSLFLRRRGWNVVNLGANVPLSRMEEALARIQPGLVVLSAQQLTAAISLRSMARLILDKQVQVAYGGRIFNQIVDLRDRIPAHFLGVTLEAAMHTIETLATRPAPAPAEKMLSRAEEVLAEDYFQKRQMIEKDAADILHQQRLEIEHLSTANYFLGNTLNAALQLGDPAYLTIDMDWLRNLLAPREVPYTTLPQYLESYEQAISQNLGKQSAPIVQWIRMYRQNISTAIRAS